MQPVRAALFLILLSLAGISTPVASDQDRPSHGDRTAVLFLHGKGGDPEAGFLQGFYTELRQHGFSVAAPVMPWSRYQRQGTLEDAFASIDQQIERLSREHNRVVLAGHSMGAVVALIYAGSKPSRHLGGVVAIATAHIPQMSPLLQDITRDSVARANELTRQGKARERHWFSDLNKGESYEMEATVEHYLSFYDPAQLPDIRQLLPDIKVPVLWLSAEDDRLTYVYSHRDLFRLLPANEQSRYALLPGSHKGVMQEAAGSIVEWDSRRQK